VAAGRRGGNDLSLIWTSSHHWCARRPENSNKKFDTYIYYGCFNLLLLLLLATIYIRCPIPDDSSEYSNIIKLQQEYTNQVRNICYLFIIHLLIGDAAWRSTKIFIHTRASLATTAAPYPVPVDGALYYIYLGIQTSSHDQYSAHASHYQPIQLFTYSRGPRDAELITVHLRFADGGLLTIIPANDRFLVNSRPLELMSGAAMAT